jgi:hypothetical protein
MVEGFKCRHPGSKAGNQNICLVFSFLAILGIELKAPSLLGKPARFEPRPQFFFFFFAFSLVFLHRVSRFLPRLALTEILQLLPPEKLGLYHTKQNIFLERTRSQRDLTLLQSLIYTA